MSTTLLTVICSFVFVIYSLSFLHYKKLKDSRKSNDGRMNELPLLYLFLLGPLFFFIVNRSQRRERKRFMEGKRRFY